MDIRGTEMHIRNKLVVWGILRCKLVLAITIAERKEADKFRNTHKVFYNDYVPETKPEALSPQKSEPEEDDLPF